MAKKIVLALLAVFIILQFFRIDKENPAADPAKDFMTITNPPAEVASILKSSCYDCHSNQTKYPWYTNVQPVAWWVKDHIDHGRDELNFSEWGDYSYRRADHKLEEGVEMVEDEEMPLPSYTWAHSEARLSTEQRELLNGWFTELRESMKAAQDTTTSAPAKEEHADDGHEH